jgi:hypothetical protein
MKNIWKWILGIFVALVLVGALFGGGMVVGRRLGGNFAPGVMPHSWNVPQQPNHQNGWQHPTLGDFDRNGGWNFPPFGGFAPFGLGLMLVGGLFRLFIPLGLLALGAYFFYWLGKRASPKPAPAVVAAPAPQPEPASDPESAGDENLA